MNLGHLGLKTNKDETSKGGTGKGETPLTPPKTKRNATNQSRINSTPTISAIESYWEIAAIFSNILNTMRTKTHI